MSESRVVLITGASSGFGKETASLLSDRGFSVYGTGRNPAVKATGSGHRMLELDVDSDESVNVCVSRFLKESGPSTSL